MQRTLKRELKELEVVEREAIVTSKWRGSGPFQQRNKWLGIVLVFTINTIPGSAQVQFELAPVGKAVPERGARRPEQSSLLGQDS